jgi:hypothetical protein
MALRAAKPWEESVCGGSATGINEEIKDEIQPADATRKAAMHSSYIWHELEQATQVSVERDQLQTKASINSNRTRDTR